MNFEPSNENSYNNADSFAMAFDSAWNACDLKKNKNLNVEEKIQITLDKINNHPFLIENPNQSREIAIFRIKLLGLS
tara:strand:- start:1069 stop:1299 length:231 start_codon:yes stop_codon:yes gene_type:complete